MRLVVLLSVLAAVGLAHYPDENREKRGAPFTRLPRWPNPVPYRIEDTFSAEQKATIRTGIASIRDNTCIDFAENTADQYKLVYTHTTSADCSSKVGDTRFQFASGPRDHHVFLGEGCEILGHLQHETLHALGVDHTQNRADRDTYLIVDETNIRENKSVNFAKIPLEYSPDYGIPFEYGSRMIYPPYLYNARRGVPVMTTRDITYMEALGSAPVLTFYDFKIINTMYNCTGKYSVSCPATTTTCQNGGYPHPRDCSRCICGDFHDGKYCEIERALLSLQAGGEPQVVTYNKTGALGFDNLTPFDWANMQPEIRVIKAPKGSRIRVTFDAPFTKVPVEEFLSYNPCPRLALTCDEFGIEIADEDLLLAGRKHCCNATTYVSKSNVIGYRAFSLPTTTFRSKVTFSVEPDTSVPTTAQPTTTTKATVPTTSTTTIAPTTTTTTAPTTTTKPTTPTTTTLPTTTTKPTTTTTTTTPVTTTKPTTTTTTAPTTTTKPTTTTTTTTTKPTTTASTVTTTTTTPITTAPTTPTTITVPTTTTKPTTPTTTPAPTTTTTTAPTTPTTTTSSVPTATKPPRPFPPKPVFSPGNCAKWNVFAYDAKRSRCLANVVMICTEQEWEDAQTKSYALCKAAAPTPTPGPEPNDCGLGKVYERVPGEPVDALYGKICTNPNFCTDQQTCVLAKVDGIVKSHCCILEY